MSQHPPVADPARCLTQLRRHVEALIDSDQLLPADGCALLQMLQQARERVVAGDLAGAGGLLLGVETLLKALHDAGVLDSKESDLCLVAARVTAESLLHPSA